MAVSTESESSTTVLVKNKDYSALSQHDVDDTVIANNNNNNNNQKDNSYNDVSLISSNSSNGNFADVVSRLKL